MFSCITKTEQYFHCTRHASENWLTNLRGSTSCLANLPTYGRRSSQFSDRHIWKIITHTLLRAVSRDLCLVTHVGTPDIHRGQRREFFWRSCVTPNAYAHIKAAYFKAKSLLEKRVSGLPWAREKPWGRVFQDDFTRARSSFFLGYKMKRQFY